VAGPPTTLYQSHCVLSRYLNSIACLLFTTRVAVRREVDDSGSPRGLNRVRTGFSRSAPCQRLSLIKVGVIPSVFNAFGYTEHPTHDHVNVEGPIVLFLDGSSFIGSIRRSRVCLQ